MLDLALVLSLAAQCAPQVAPQTLAAIAWTESRFDPLAIGVNVTPRRAYRFSNKADAVSEAERLMAEGRNLDLGLAQINSANLGWLGLSVAEVFDPCRNLAAAGTVLQVGYQPASARLHHRQTALRVALSRYNTGDPRRGFRNGYVAKVERAAADLGLIRPASASNGMATTPARAAVGEPAVPQALSPAPPAWDIFARTRSAPWATFSAPSQIDRSQP